MALVGLWRDLSGPLRGIVQFMPIGRIVLPELSVPCLRFAQNLRENGNVGGGVSGELQEGVQMCLGGGLQFFPVRFGLR